MRTIKEIIEHELGRFNASAPKMNINAGTRYSGALDRLRKNLDAVSIEIGGIELDESTVAEIKNMVPNCRKKPLVYQTVAGDLALEIYDF